MSDYTLQATWSTKDALSTGTALKAISATELGTEFSAIETAIATKYDTNDIASQAQAEAEASNAVIMTPLRVANWADYNAGMVGDIQALADPNADVFLGWDDSAGAAIGFTAGSGIVFNGTQVDVDHDAATNFVSDEHVAHSGVTLTAGAGLTGGGTIAASRSFAVGAGNGITVNADDVALAAASVSATNPISVASGVIGFDPSSLTALTIESAAGADSLVIWDDDAAAIKTIPINATGTKIAASSTTTIDTQAEANQIYVNTSASDHTMTIAPEATFDFPVGTEIGFVAESTGKIILAAGAGVTINSLSSFLDVKASGGGAYIVKTGTNIWTLLGDLE